MSSPFGPGPMKVIGSTEPDAIYLGHYYDTKTMRVGPELRYGGTRHATVLGPTGSGKGARLLIPNLLSSFGKSILVLDPKGQNAAVTAAWRRTVSDVLILNPFGVLTDIYPDLESVGFEALEDLDPTAATFCDDVAAGIAEPMIRVEGKEPHWSESARGLTQAAAMWEVKQAKRQKRRPRLENIRALLTEPDEYHRDANGKRRLVRGLRITAAKMCAQGGYEIGSLIGRFMRGNDEISGIQSTFDTQTRWMLSGPMRADMRKNGIDFGRLKTRPTTIYVILPAEYLVTHSAYMRLIIATALRKLFRAGGVPVLFMLDEYYTLGRLDSIEAAFGLVRGYGVQLMPVLQSLVQLKALYQDDYENVLGQSGAIFGLTPNDWFTAEWMSRRSGETTIRQPTAGLNTNPSGAVGQSTGEGYGRRRYLMPQDLFGMHEGFGVIWCAGLGRPITAYLPPYWQVERWRKRARPDPYHFGRAAE